MLEVTISWDWFFDTNTPQEELQAMKEGRLAACVREDGDDNAAIVEAVASIKAPKEHIRLATMNPCIADCFLAVAWDDRSVDCKPNDEEEDDWTF